MRWALLTLTATTLILSVACSSGGGATATPTLQPTSTLDTPQLADSEVLNLIRANYATCRNIGGLAYQLKSATVTYSGKGTWLVSAPVSAYGWDWQVELSGRVIPTGTQPFVCE